MAVCATPTTMIATLPAISSVFRSFITFLPRGSGASPSSSIAIGGGIVEPHDRGRTAVGPDRLGVSAFLRGQLLGQGERAVQCPGQIVAHQDGIGQFAKARLDHEGIHGHAGVGVDGG